LNSGRGAVLPGWDSWVGLVLRLAVLVSLEEAFLKGPGEAARLVLPGGNQCAFQ